MTKQRNESKIILLYISVTFILLSSGCINKNNFSYSVNEFEYTHKEIEIDQLVTKKLSNSNNSVPPIYRLEGELDLGKTTANSFKFCNNLNHTITGFVIYAGGHEIVITGSFQPGKYYVINFDNLNENYTITAIGIFFNHEEWWTFNEDDGIRSILLE
jgi:uncharacterized membrane protein